MLTFKVHAKPVHGVAFSPDGRSLATSSGDQTVKVWDFATSAVVRQLPGGASIFAAPLAFSPDGRFLGRGGDHVTVWPIDSDQPVISIPKLYTESIAFAPDSSEVAACASDRTLSRWSLPDGKPLPGGWGGTRAENDGNQFPSGSLAYSADGTMIAIAYGVLVEGEGFTSQVLLWDRETGTRLGELKAAFIHAHPTAIAFSPDGSLLAGVYGPALQVFAVATRQQVASVKPGKKHFKGLAFTPNGRRLVTVNNDKAVRVYDTATWAEVGGYEWKIGKLGCVAVARDGLRMAAGSDTGKVVVWDVDL